MIENGSSMHECRKCKGDSGLAELSEYLPSFHNTESGMKPAPAAMCLPGWFCLSPVSANPPKAGQDNRTTASTGKMRLIWWTWNYLKPNFSLPGSPGMMPEIG